MPFSIFSVNLLPFIEKSSFCLPFTSLLWKVFHQLHLHLHHNAILSNPIKVYWKRKKSSEELEWSHNSSHVILQLTQCFANAMVGPRSWIAGLFTRSPYKRHDKVLDFCLTPHLEQRLQKLQERMRTPFDETRPDHQEALRSLWIAAFPDIPLKGLISEQWKDMGWQGANPSTDFRGCGFISLENLLFFSRTYPVIVQAGWAASYLGIPDPFAVAGINVSFMLIQMLDLQSEKPRRLPGVTFVKLLGEDESAFDVLFCIAFEMMDAQWLAMRASYMEFNVYPLLTLFSTLMFQ
uniref:ELMO domain-containing protein n=2 Tax=Salix viminalis TaxID=40686 RepID=A0A6N2LYR4_SALVM